MDIVTEKICTKCLRPLPLDSFYKRGDIESNPDARQSHCKICVSEQRKEWRAKNAELHKERNRVWQQNNRMKVRDRQRRWRSIPENREKELERNRANKSYSYRNYRARKVKADGSFTTSEFEELCEKLGNICVKCRKSLPLEADHVVPISKGGTNYISNIQPLCRSCNARKATKPFDYKSKQISFA